MSVPIGYPTADEFAVGSGPTAADTFPVQRADYTTLPATASRFAILHDLPGRPIAEFSASLDRTGAQDMSGLINDCIASYTAAGNPVAIGAGVYRNGSTINLVDDARILLSPGAVMLKDFAGTHIGQASTDATVNRVLWRGGIIRNPSPVVLTGNVFRINLTDSELCDFFIDEWEGRAIFIVGGTRVRIHDFEAISVQDGGGIRLQNCSDVIVENGYVTCGDDALMFSASATSGLTEGTAQITERCQYVNMTAFSWNARVCTAVQARAGLSDDTYNVIRDCAWVGVRGRGRRAVSIGNLNSLARTERITLTAGHFDCSFDTTGGGDAIAILGEDTMGGVRDVTLRDVTVLSPLLCAVGVGDAEGRGNAKRITFDRCYFGPSRGARENVRIFGQAEVDLVGCTIVCKSDEDGMLIGSLGANRTRAKIRDGSITQIGTSRQGIDIRTSERVEIDGVRFAQADGATTVRAIDIASGSLGVRVGNNDYSGLTTAAQITFPSTENSGCRINGGTLRTVTSNTTIRLQDSGQTTILRGSGARTMTLPAAAFGLEYTFAQEGTGALTVSATGDDVIRIPGGASTAGGSIASGAQGNHVRIIGLDDVTWLAVSISGTWTPA
jgi:hypothetical protein